MNVILANFLIFSNVILCYIVRELWKDNKKHREVIKLQDNILKEYYKTNNNETTASNRQ